MQASLECFQKAGRLDTLHMDANTLLIILTEPHNSQVSEHTDDDRHITIFLHSKMNTCKHCYIESEC